MDCCPVQDVQCRVPCVSWDELQAHCHPVRDKCLKKMNYGLLGPEKIFPLGTKAAARPGPVRFLYLYKVGLFVYPVLRHLRVSIGAYLPSWQLGYSLDRAPAFCGSMEIVFTGRTAVSTHVNLSTTYLMPACLEKQEISVDVLWWGDVL